MMSNFRPEFHVAQQSRRHKLRHHNHVEDDGTSDNLRQLGGSQGVNESDFMQIRGSRYENMSYDPSLFQESSAAQSSRRIQQGENSGVVNLSNYNNWGRVGSPQVCDWNMADYGGESGGIGRSTEELIVGVGLGGDIRKVKTNNSLSSLDPRPGYFGEDVNYSSSSLYQNTLQDVVSLATRGSKDSKMPCSGQQTGLSGGGDELVPPRTSSNQWMDRTNDRSDGGGVRGDLRCSSHALSLSLSGPSSLKRSNAITGDCFDYVPSSNCPKEPRPFISNSTQLVPPNCSQDMVQVAPAFNHREIGPLGPFTGYATILTCSKFLKPAEQLLENFCNVGSPDVLRSSQESSKLAFDDGFSSEHVERGSGGDSAGSSTFGRNDKRAKLLYLQYEVSRMYKRVHQQMQLVVSSFESVAGLSSAAPYFYLAVDKISKHFNSLKNSISNQIRNLRKVVEDSSSPSSLSKLKFIDPAMQKQVVSGGSVPMFESQSHVWRPQRGLPERAVAVLRAWLFDHFLHPYPTDTDKHMLANRTGLTRNQVSNWFINARVRLWKPMIEEIHMLEGKELADSSDTNAGKPDNGSGPTDDGRQDMNSQLDCAGVTASTSAGNRLNDDFWNLGKRPCPDYRTPATTMDGSLIGFSPYHRTGIGMEGLEAVSLTLGLRQSVEAAQQQLQHFGGQTIHDFGRL